MKSPLIFIVYLSFSINSLSQVPEPDNEKINAASEWIKKNNVPLNTLHKVPKEEIYFNCDSMLFRKKRIGDTLIIWSTGVDGMRDLTDKYDKKFLPDFINNESFGTSSYIKKIDYDGRIETVSMIKHVFLIKKDSLFEEVEYFTIPQEIIDSMYEAWSKLIIKTAKSNSESAAVKQQADSLKKEIDSYTKNKFRLLFHCSMFKNGKRKHFTSKSKGKCDDVIILEGFSKNGNIEYYEVRVTNDCSKDPTSYAFAFDNNFRFVYWEGCLTNELNKAKGVAKKDSPSCK